MTTREYVEPTPLASRLTLPLCLTLALLLCLVLAQALPRHTPAQPAPEPAPEPAALLNAGAIAANEALYGLPKPGALAALGLAKEDLTPHPDGYTGYFCAPPAQALGGEEYSRYLVFDYLDRARAKAPGPTIPAASMSTPAPARRRCSRWPGPCWMKPTPATAARRPGSRAAR